MTFGGRFWQSFLFCRRARLFLLNYFVYNILEWTPACIRRRWKVNSESLVEKTSEGWKLPTTWLGKQWKFGSIAEVCKTNGNCDESRTCKKRYKWMRNIQNNLQSGFFWRRRRRPVLAKEYKQESEDPQINRTSVLYI